MKNYIEHEQRVAYVDGLLAHSQEWNWLITYIETEFDVNFSMSGFKDFDSIYRQIGDVLQMLIKVNEIMKGRLVIHQPWLKEIYTLSLYYLGINDCDAHDLDTDFGKTLLLLMYLAKIRNEISKDDVKYILYDDIIRKNNIYKIIDILPFQKEADYIVSLMDAVTYSTEKEKKIFFNNINQQKQSCLKFIQEYKNEILNANCFAFKSNKNVSCSTWEEQYLSQMLTCEYDHGMLRPFFTDRDGGTSPNISLWTENVLSIMQTDFSDSIADFVIESVRYALFQTSPSVETIHRHFELLSEYYDQLGEENVDVTQYPCSSLEFSISFLNDEVVQCDSECLRLFNLALRKIKDIQWLNAIDARCKILDKSLQKTIQKFITEKLRKAKLIDNAQDFLSFIEDRDVIAKADQAVFVVLSDKFESVIEANTGVETSNLFLEYLLFLLKIENNRNIISRDIATEIVYIRSLWRETHFEKVVNSMQCFTDNISLRNDTMEAYNNLFFAEPLVIAQSCMCIEEKEIMDIMSCISDNPLSLFANKITISEDFPRYQSFVFDNRRPLDLMYKAHAEKIRNANGYKLLNPFSIERFLPEIYRSIEKEILVRFSLFYKTEELYQIVSAQNSEYELLDYCEEPLLAHLTQFFPILESKIREYGELIGIPAICQSPERYYNYKEPSSVLAKIVKEIYDQTGTLDTAAEFMFIYYCLFSENGMNIRNACVHGFMYTKDKKSIKIALKIVLFCVYLLDYRMKCLHGIVNEI